MNFALEDSDSSLALSNIAAGERLSFFSVSSSEGSYASDEHLPGSLDAPEAAGGAMEEVREQEIVPEVFHYPIPSQRHAWCVDEEHLHYQPSYQHQIVHAFSSTFVKAYRCFGRSRGRRLTVLEVRQDICFVRFTILGELCFMAFVACFHVGRAVL